MSDEERKQCKVVAAQVKTDDLMAFVYYGKVKHVAPSGTNITVYDVDNKREMAVQGKELIESSFSADQYQEEVKVNKTKAAEILVSSINRPIKVSFDKQDGTERILRGRMIQPEPLLGRSMVEDLDIADGHRLRQIDHRTINWLVVDGVKYVVK
jgi:hypothetical protein